MSVQVSTRRDDSLRNRARLLFVDDEQKVLSSMRALFRRDYEVFVANSGDEALKIIDRESINVVVSDQRMPRMTGVEVLSACKERSPSTVRILLTGYADLSAIEASINEGEVFRYLVKPCATDELRVTIAMAVDNALGNRQRGGGTAELIPFPRASTKSTAATATDVVPATVTRSAPAVAAVATKCKVDVLALTSDDDLVEGLRESIGNAQTVHVAEDIERAIEKLAQHPIGVVVTDTAINGVGVDVLLKSLKREVPALVTIVASDRSDANSLIGLINQGIIFRFLLKPIRIGQCRLWIDSAVRRFNERSDDCSLPSPPVASPTIPPRSTEIFRSFLKSVVVDLARLYSRVSSGARKQWPL